MLINKDTIRSMETLTEEERNNPELIRNRKEYKDAPVSVYYGSEKEGLINTCLDCKKRNVCKQHFDAEWQQKWLRKCASDAKATVGLTKEEIEKLKTNVFIIVNCVNKEKR